MIFPPKSDWRAGTCCYARPIRTQDAYHFFNHLFCMVFGMSGGRRVRASVKFPDTAEKLLSSASFSVPGLAPFWPARFRDRASFPVGLRHPTLHPAPLERRLGPFAFRPSVSQSHCAAVQYAPPAVAWSGAEPQSIPATLPPPRCAALPSSTCAVLTVVKGLPRYQARAGISRSIAERTPCIRCSGPSRATGLCRCGRCITARPCRKLLHQVARSGFQSPQLSSRWPITTWFIGVFSGCLAIWYGSCLLWIK